MQPVRRWVLGSVRCLLPSFLATTLILVLFALFPATALARDIYVDAVFGSDLGAGSPAAPVKSIKRGMAVSASGDTVHVAPGTYDALTTGETFPIGLKSGVVLIGSGDSTTTIRGSSSTSVIVANGVSDAVLDGFTITGGAASYGGGIRVTGGGPTITNNTISGNVGGWGGAIYDSGSSLTLVGNRIVSNVATWGAGLDSSSSGLRISGNTFCGNTAVWGGALYLSGNAVTIDNNVIRSNAAAVGGGVRASHACTFVNDTIVDNSGGGINDSSGSSTAVNCILWGNGDDLSGCSATYSDIEDGDPGTGNMFASPQFVSQSTGDLRLARLSPCIDSADASRAAAVDIRNITRPLDGNGDGTALPDTGAYEFAPPTAADDTATAQEDATLTVATPGVLGNDGDVEGYPLSTEVSALPVHGSLSLAADGSYTYRPAPDYAGTDAFSYRATDGSARSAPATVTIVVAPVEDAPVAAEDTATTTEDTILAVDSPGILANDRDVDGDELSPAVVGRPEHGTLDLSADGSYSYRSAPDFFGTDAFSYRVSDGTTLSAPATVTIVVTSVDDPPVAAEDSATVTERDVLVVGAPGVLANDTDVESDRLSAALVADPLHGSLSFNADGSYTYHPAPDFFGTDAFSYQASDGATLSAPATVTITVRRSVAILPVEGGDRYATAIAASRSTFATGSCSTLVVATGGKFPDALGAAALAGAVRAPILLVSGNTLRADIKQEMLRLTRGKTSKKVYILGSELAVSSGMVRSIQDALGAPSARRRYVRLGGADRYGTSRAVAMEVGRLAGGSFSKDVIVTTGLDFPDALLAGPVAYARTTPIVIVRDSVGPDLSAALQSLGVSNAIIIGATSTVSPAVETQLRSLLGEGHVSRPCAERDRYGQSVAVARWAVSDYGLSWNLAGLATGEVFPDGLTASAPQGVSRAVILLTPRSSLDPRVRDALSENKHTVDRVRFFGSVLAVTADVRTAVADTLK